MKTNVYTQNLEWLKVNAKRYPYLVKESAQPCGLEPDGNGVVIVVPFYNYTVYGFKFLDDYREKLTQRSCEPFDLATLVKPCV